jgi:hypothetical protein
MTTETSTTLTNEQICRALIERGFNNGDLDGLDELVAHDSVEHQEGSTSGIDGGRAWMGPRIGTAVRRCDRRATTQRSSTKANPDFTYPATW